MKHHIFLSYPIPDQYLVENFANHLERHGVKAWVYSLDRTLSSDIWCEIEAQINKAELFAFVASENSRDAKGQHKELGMAIEKVQNSDDKKFRLLPIVIGGLSFSELPSPLKNINGLRLDAHTVESTAHQLAKSFFPDLFDDARDRHWRCPKPGQWLEVHHIDPGIEEHLTMGDLLYFRRLSPLGLFECYSPKLDGLFWVGAEDVRASGIAQHEHPDVPRRYLYWTSYEYERLGLDLDQRSASPSGQL